MTDSATGPTRIRPGNTRTPATLALLGVLLAAILTGCSPPTFAAATTPAPAGAALAALANLAVKGRAPMTGYSRDVFGPAWADTDHNRCDQRNDVLARDLHPTTLRPGSTCIVASGVLHDPYTGRTITFVRGRGTSRAVQIDHVVALADAWQTGAQQLTPARREALATDPTNLLAVDGPTNERKGASDAASWLPPVKAYRCAYVARQVAVKARYQLWTTPAEHDAIARVLTTCPTQPLPTTGDTP